MFRKSAITRYANQKGMPFSWQKGYYDRIIRTIRELNAIALYIEQNPSQWSSRLG